MLDADLRSQRPQRRERGEQAHRGERGVPLTRERRSGEQGRVSADQLDALCPDWRDRETALATAIEVLQSVVEYWREEGKPFWVVILDVAKTEFAELPQFPAA